LQISASYMHANNVDMWLATLNAQINAYGDDVVMTLKYGGTNCSEIGEPDGVPYTFNLMSSLLFSISIFTTIGRHRYNILYNTIIRLCVGLSSVISRNLKVGGYIQMFGVVYTCTCKKRKFTLKNIFKKSH